MSTRLQWRSLQVARRLWFRATGFSLVAVAIAILAIFVEPEMPEGLPRRIGVDAVGDLLNIIAASMLSVTIFSLSTVVAAHAAATSDATPRATLLLNEDQTSQNALAMFIGAFIFSLVGVIALQTGLYDERGRVTLYLLTLLVIALIVATLLRWIDHVTGLGRVAETAERVSARAAQVLKRHVERPWLGGTPLAAAAVPDDAVPVHPESFGYVQHIDMHVLDRVADREELTVYVRTRPGGYADACRPLMLVSRPVPGEVVDALRKAFTVDDVRTFDQDPRYGLVVLGEIGTRALSAAINDPGTAIDVLGRLGRLLALLAVPAPASAAEVDHPRIHVPAIPLADFFDDAFPQIARDGAAVVPVAIRLQKVLRSLAALGGEFAGVARGHAAYALACAGAARDAGEDLDRIREAAAEAERG